MASTSVLDDKQEEQQNDDSLQSKRRQQAAIEGPSPDNADNEDPCNSKLEESDPEVVKALRAIVGDLARQSLVARRWQIRRVRRAELYWQSLQYLWVNPVDNQLYTPTEARVFDDSAAQDQPRYQFVTNIYQPYGLGFIAVTCQDIPGIAFFPDDPNDEDDITAAKAAKDVADLIQRNNDPEEIFQQFGYHAWTGGLIAIHVRFVTDGQKFGWDSVDDMAEGIVNLSEEQYLCSECGTESPIGNPTGICPGCGSPLGDENIVPAETASVPMSSKTMRIPRGQEVISVHGALESNDPIWANSQDEFPYHALAFEVPRSKLKSAYPWAADKLSMDGNVLADDQYARVSRISVKESIAAPIPTDMLYDLITLTRTWLRPWVFESIKDNGVKERAYELFPDGCYVAFGGGAYCESRNESMDSCWVIRHAMPGQGVNRPAIGDTLLDIQDQVNTYRNIAVETYEYGIAPEYDDPETLDFDALNKQTSEPGSIIPARQKQGQALGDSFYQAQSSVASPQMLAELEMLVGPLAQLLTGMFPALFGGDTGGNDTAKGIGIQRDQALGRVGLPWKVFKGAWAKAVELAVKCFRDNRSDDVSMAHKDPSKKSLQIRIGDLKGNFSAYVEGDSAYPRTRSEMRASIERLLGMVKDIPALGELFAQPANMELLQRLEGIDDFDIPGADARDKQLKEIDLMLDGTMIPIFPLDYDNYEFMECTRWASTEAGIQSQQTSPQTYALVMEHANLHLQRMMSKQQGNQKEDKPSLSIQYQALPPEGQVQLAAMAGIQLTPQQIQAQAVKDTLLKKMPVGPGGPGTSEPKNLPPAAGKRPSGISQGAK